MSTAHDPPALTDFERWWRSRLPAWLQWMLCLPCAAIAAVLIAQLVKLFITSRDDIGCVVYAVDLAFPAVAFATFLWLFWSMVPRAKYELCIALIAFRSLITLAFVALTIAALFGIEALRDFGPTDVKWWLSLLAELLAMVAGIVTVREMKHSLDDAELAQQPATQPSADLRTGTPEV